MSDPVLTDNEKEALLEGMSSGEIEVTSARGPAYASVLPFEIGPRSRIVSNSYPRLQSLNKQCAGRIAKQSEQLLNAEITVVFNAMDSATYSDFCEGLTGLSLVVEFMPSPLQGSGLIYLNSVVVETLVETFYGGVGNDPVRQDAEFFTPGEINVARLFCDALLGAVSEVWQPLQEISPEVSGTHLSTAVIDSVDSGDATIFSEFEIDIGGKKQPFQIVWPVSTIAPLLPVFEGQKRERDVIEDARWESALRARVTDSMLRICAGVGQTHMTLGEVAELGPGDVVAISNPRKGTVSANQVAILEGRFGVHDGRCAIEATHWLDPQSEVDAATRH